MATVIILRDFLTGNLNSSVDCEIDSNPANAHGARNTMNSDPPRAVWFGENAGSTDGAELPLGLRSIYASAISTPAARTSAITI